MKPGILQEEKTGPFAERAFLHLAFDALVKPETLVWHPTYTHGKWVTMEQLPGLLAKYEEGVQHRQRQKEEQAAAKEQARREMEAANEQARREKEAAKEAQRQAAIRQAAEQRANSPIAHFLLDGQSETVVTKLYNRVCEILTQQEGIEYIAVQAKPLVIAPDCVVITNRRFIIFHQKMLGQMDFDDYPWLSLSNAQMKEGMVYGEISFRVSDGRTIMLDYLPKAQARRIYRIAQEREEQGLEVRRNRWMEEQRAGATNIVVNAQVPAQAASAPVIDAAVVTNDDPVAKLQKLKAMLDQGLIEQAEYDAAKAKILASL